MIAGMENGTPVTLMSASHIAKASSVPLWRVEAAIESLKAKPAFRINSVDYFAVPQIVAIVEAVGC